MFLNCSANTLRFADLPTRVSAAASAGFTSIGLRLTDYLDAGLSDAEIRELLEQHHMRVLELEHTWDWAAGEDPAEETMLRVADCIGLRHLIVPMFWEYPLDDLVEPFAAMCDRAAQHGVQIGFEFIPYSYVRTLADVWHVVSAADRPNGGITLDLWQWFRSGGRLSELSEIPTSAITTLQISDVLADPEPDMTEEARHRRLLPGAGAGDTFGVLGALCGRGVAVPVSVEVFSDELDSLAAMAAARSAFDAGSTTIKRAGLTAPPWTASLGKETR